MLNKPGRVALVALMAALLRAAAAQQTPPFEVASVKPSPPFDPQQIIAGKQRIGSRMDAGRVEMNGVPLAEIINTAFGSVVSSDGAGLARGRTERAAVRRARDDSGRRDHRRCSWAPADAVLLRSRPALGPMRAGEDMMSAARAAGLNLPPNALGAGHGASGAPAASDPSGTSLFNSNERMGLKLDARKLPSSTSSSIGWSER